MNEQIKINVPDGFHAVQNADGTIDIVPGAMSVAPSIAVIRDVERWDYKRWDLGTEWRGAKTGEWYANHGMSETHRRNNRPEESQVVRAVRPVRTVTVEITANDWDDVAEMATALKDAIGGLNRMWQS